MNLWIPDPPPKRDAVREAAVRAYLRGWGPEVPESAGDATPPDFAAQCEAFLKVGPPIVSSVMGLYPSAFVQQLKEREIPGGRTCRPSPRPARRRRPAQTS